MCAMMQKDVNHITGQILDAGIKVHNDLGPGLFESIYEQVLSYELNKRGFCIQKQKTIPVMYDGQKMEDGFRADLVVENLVIIEIKSVENLLPVHFKQLYTYLKLSDISNGILINFNISLLKDGFHRLFNNYVKGK
jgi:GxxExxY protein